MMRQRRPVRVFMDGTDWQYELGVSRDGNTVYPSKKALMREAKHDLTECGIAEVRVSFIRWVRKPRRPRRIKCSMI